MIKHNNIVLIAMGNKARQGKDFCANIIMQTQPFTIIMHWADALYDELRNKDRRFPLVYLDKHFINLLINYQDGAAEYYAIPKSDVQSKFLLDIFKKRNISEYWGMDEKDSEMLQFWGTNFRRNYFSENYWVDRTVDSINSYISVIENDIYFRDNIYYIIIPDTRFKNEYAMVKHLGGYYVNIERYNLDERRFIAEDRDPRHLSECDLDDVRADFNIQAMSGDTNQLEIQTKRMLIKIKMITDSRNTLWEKSA